MIIHKDSHTDHAITQAQWHHILNVFEGRTGFFIETITLPQGLGFVFTELYGPSCGDPPVLEADVHYGRRGDRQWDSRLVKAPNRPTRFVRVIAGPHDGHNCVLFTAYGVMSLDMPLAPKEPGAIAAQLEARVAADPTPSYETLRDALCASQRFWMQHALATEIY